MTRSLPTALRRVIRPDRVLWRLFGTVLWHRWALDPSSTFTGTDPDAAPEAEGLVHWIARVDVGGSVKPALYMPPSASRTFSVRVPPRGAVRASLALLPEAWDKQRGGVTFRISARPMEGGPSVRRAWVIDPGKSRRDRAWKTVTLDLSRLAGRMVEVELATLLPPDASADYAWAVWGEPELLQGKSLTALLRRQLYYARALGVAGTLRRYRAFVARATMGEITYEAWLKRRGYRNVDVPRLRQASARFALRPKISLITPVRDTDPRWLRVCVDSVRGQAYPEWELCLCDDGSSDPATLACLREVERLDPRIKLDRLPEPRGTTAAAQRALSMATSEFVGLLDAHDQLTEEALYRLVEALNARPDADLLYPDEDRLEADGSLNDPYFKPDWSPDHLRSTMYIGRLALYRRSVVDDVGGIRSELEGAHHYDLALRVTERTDRIVHVPRILYHRRRVPAAASSLGRGGKRPDDAAMQALADHLARQRLGAVVEPRPGGGCWRVRYQIVGDPLVSIIIPTAGRIVQTGDGPRDLVLDCVRSIAERTAYKRYELLVIDDGYLSEAAREYLATIPHRRITYAYAGPFNFSAKLDFAAKHAHGEHLLLLNDDTQVIGEEWLSAMLELSQQPDVGAVGAKLYYPEGRIQHAGIVLGFISGADHPFRGQPMDHPGYFGSARIIRNYSAVTAACLMTRRAVFDEVGGLDPRFASDFGDVDYCLRLGQRGYRVLFTPFAELYHHEGGSFGSRVGKVHPREIQAFGQRWASLIDNDPFYNPNLTRTSLDYGLRM